ncbi:MAG TPA: YjjG family noncanonical pyrimidine nucleotidase [Lunatimonas sp.]|nr:YjjG family noncanonical pyrimidine nucleotidase [Lunatimonas sp.]
MTKIYKHLFFDLDHTLWDYDKNVEESLSELYLHYNLPELGISSFDKFFSAFEQVNYGLWDRYNVGGISKEELRQIRFRRIFETVAADPDLVPEPMESHFMTNTSSKPHVIADTFDILNYLRNSYCLHIITNGFNESQAQKMNAAGLTSYFDLIVTSETTGHRKPDRRIFDYAVEQLGAKPEECVMIGDNPLSDIAGAQNAGIDQIYFNPKGIACSVKATHTIQQLMELKGIL